MREPLTNDLIREWREASVACPHPISLDRKIIELADLVLILRAQRDDLQARNSELVEQRRAADARAAIAKSEGREP